MLVLAPYTLRSPAVHKIATDAESNNTDPNRTTQQTRRTGINRTTPVHSGISEVPTPHPSDNIRTRINAISKNSTPYTSGISGTSAAPPAGGIWSPGIGNIWQSTSPNIREFDELNADVDRKFSNNLIVPPVITQVFREKISGSPIRDIYARCGVNLATDHVNPMESQLLDHGLYTVNSLNKGAGICSPATITIRSWDVPHWSAADHAIVKSAAVGDAVVAKLDYREENYKTNFKIWMENTKLQFERENIKKG